MNTNNHTLPPSNALTAEVRARVPDWMKDAVEALASKRVGAVGADIVREAVSEYLERQKEQPAQPEQVTA